MKEYHRTSSQLLSNPYKAGNACACSLCFYEKKKTCGAYVGHIMCLVISCERPFHLQCHCVLAVPRHSSSSLKNTNERSSLFTSLTWFDADSP